MPHTIRDWQRLYPSGTLVTLHGGSAWWTVVSVWREPRRGPVLARIASTNRNTTAVVAVEKLARHPADYRARGEGVVL